MKNYIETLTKYVETNGKTKNSRYSYLVCKRVNLKSPAKMMHPTKGIEIEVSFITLMTNTHLHVSYNATSTNTLYGESLLTADQLVNASKDVEFTPDSLERIENANNDFARQLLTLAILDRKPGEPNKVTLSGNVIKVNGRKVGYYEKDCTGNWFAEFTNPAGERTRRQQRMLADLRTAIETQFID